MPNPPRLDEWRQTLFDVDGVIALTEEEYIQRAKTLCGGHLELTILQIPDIFPACRQRLLPPFDAEVQAQTVCFSLLGLPLERTTAGYGEI